jgi:hypothetical protein
VHALDADTGAQIWRTSLGAPVPLSPPLQCGNINPMGVTGTPTIDPATEIVLSRSVCPAAQWRAAPYGVRPFARDRQDSAGLAGRRQGRARRARPGLQRRAQGQRSALTIVNGKLYVPYAGHFGDCGAYNGMVVALNLARPAVFGVCS